MRLLEIAYLREILSKLEARKNAFKDDLRDQSLVPRTALIHDVLNDDDAVAIELAGFEIDQIEEEDFIKLDGANNVGVYRDERGIAVPFEVSHNYSILDAKTGEAIPKALLIEDPSLMAAFRYQPRPKGAILADLKTYLADYRDHLKELGESMTSISKMPLEKQIAFLERHHCRYAGI